MTLSKMETVVNRGIRGEVPDTIEVYNLAMIIAVGYRVSSLRATQFRIWATSVLTEYETFNRTQHIESDFDKAIK